MGSHVMDSHQPSYTAEQALARLQEGNARFVSGHARFPTVQQEVLAELAIAAESPCCCAISFRRLTAST